MRINIGISFRRTPLGTTLIAGFTLFSKPSPMHPDQTAQLNHLLEILINGPYARNKQGTMAQFLTVLLACCKPGITAAEIARALGQNESSVSRNLKTLGPNGTGCLTVVGKRIDPSEVVLHEIEAMFPKN